MPARNSFVRWIPPLGWMALIFFASTDALSGEHTSRFVIPLIRWLLPHATAPTVDFIHLCIRKCGHLTEYAILCILLWRAVPDRPRRYTLGDWMRAGLALLAATCYAATDEYHQSFVPSRTAAVHDVMIDACGALLGLAVLWMAGAWNPRRRVPAAVAAE